MTRVCSVADILYVDNTQHYIALSRDPSTRHLDGQFQLWTEENVLGQGTTHHRPRPGSLYDGCPRVSTGIYHVL